MAQDKDDQIVVVYYSSRYRRSGERRKGNSLVTVLSFPHPEDGLNWAKGIPRYLLARTVTDPTANEALKRSVKLIDGGYREDFAAELWLVPIGAPDLKPVFSPTLKKSEIRYGTKKPRSIPDYFNCYAGR